MTAYVLALLSAIIVVLLVERFFAERSHRVERSMLVKAAMARHMPEFAALTRVIADEPGFAPLPKQREPRPGRDPEMPAQPVGMNGN